LGWFLFFNFSVIFVLFFTFKFRFHYQFSSEIPFLPVFYQISKTLRMIRNVKLHFCCLLFLFIQPCFFSSVAAQIISTLGANPLFIEGGAATATGLNYPNGVAIHSNGNVYIADYQNHRIRMVTPAGNIITVAGTGVAGYNGDDIPASTAQLNFPYGVSLDNQGNIYISDLGNNRVRKVIAWSGKIVTIAGTGAAGYNGDNIAGETAQLNAPVNTVVDAGGNVFIVDFLNQRVRKLQANNIIVTVAGTGQAGYNGDNIAATTAQLNYPYGITLDANNDGFFLADVANNRIRKINSSNIITTVVGTGAGGFSGDNGPGTQAQILGAYGVAVDAANALFISDTYNHRIRMLSQGGIITTIAGTGVAGFNGEGLSLLNARFNEPTGIAVDQGGNLLIADSRNNRIRKFFAFGGNINTVAGNGTINYQGAGSDSILLSECTDISIDVNGNIYAADAGANRVIRIGKTGIVNTIAGTGISGYDGDDIPAVNAQLNRPQSIYADKSGNIYISTSDFRVRKVTANGIIKAFAGNGFEANNGDGGQATDASIGLVTGITGDSKGNIYCADYSASVVRKIDTSGNISTIAGNGSFGFSGDGGSAIFAQIGNLSDVSCDKFDNIYITHTSPNAVRKVDTSGMISTVAGGASFNADSGDGGLATNAQFLVLASTVVDSVGNIYICDWPAHRVRMVDTNNIIHPFAGNGIRGSFSDTAQPALNVSLNQPNELALDKYGDLYISDFSNYKIHKVTMPDKMIADGSWTNPAIWAKGKIPDIYTQVTVSRSLLVDAVAVCWSLTIPPGSSAYASELAKIFIYGGLP
jgi:trimeric autotransporter adhesin